MQSNPATQSNSDCNNNQKSCPRPHVDSSISQVFQHTLPRDLALLDKRCVIHAVTVGRTLVDSAPEFVGHECFKCESLVVPLAKEVHVHGFKH